MSTRPKEYEVSGDIVDAAYKVHTTLGPDLLESMHEAVVTHELLTRGHRVDRQVSIASAPPRLCAIHLRSEAASVASHNPSSRFAHAS